MSKLKIVLAAILFSLFSVLLYQFGLFVMILWLSIKDPSSSSFMDAAMARAKATQPQSQIDFRWVPYNEISINLKRAVITSEDANFTLHGGVEWDAIRKAWEYNRKQADQGTTKRRGGSTITQQLAKNLFLSESRSYWRKAQELILTYMLELAMSKQRILELYLNVAQWGEFTFGAEAAAQKYYKTSASKLNANQAARLAAMLPNPRFYEKNSNTRYLQTRSASVRKQMHMVVVP